MSIIKSILLLELLNIITGIMPSIEIYLKQK